MDQGFTEEQKQYLMGLGQGLAAARSSRGMGAAPMVGRSAGNERSNPEQIHLAAQDKWLAAGKKLSKEEEAKRAKQPFDMWDEMLLNAKNGEYPKGTDGFLYRTYGLFYVAPAQDSFMCRLRIPNGILKAHQFKAMANLADEYGGGYAHVTTRANIQIREIQAKDAINVLVGIDSAGLTSRGAGADNLRNITGSAGAGIDPQELIDTRPLCSALHHYVLNHRELFGLPRKFNIAFDGGGKISTVEETNDIGFYAIGVGEDQVVAPGVYFRIAIGGITGHKDLARDVGVVCRPDECVAIAAAVIRSFIEHGDRTDRKKARLKYVLDVMGIEAFWADVEKRLGYQLKRINLNNCEARPAVVRSSHIGWQPQRQAGKFYVGVALPVGKMTVEQMRGIAEIAQNYGDGDIRLTVWQNLLISGVSTQNQSEVDVAIKKLGLATETSHIRAGLIACTGNKGCKLAASDTKRHALEIAEHIEKTVTFDSPINIHLTGCPNSCAQHYIGDIGLVGTKVAIDDDNEVEGYHMFIGGGFGQDAKIGNELMKNVVAEQVPIVVEGLLKEYVNRRRAQEEFPQFISRHSIEELRGFAQAAVVST